MHNLVRGGLVPAAMAYALAGCTGGGSTAPASSPNGATSNVPQSSAASFEKYRASVEASARRSVPSGFQVYVGSTYRTSDGRIFADTSVVPSSAGKIEFRVGTRTWSYDRSAVTEVPKTYIETRRAGRRPSTVIGGGGCNIDTCGGGGGDPTDPPDVPTGSDAPPVYADVSSPTASAIAAQRVSCTQSFTTNGYKGAMMSYTYFNGNVWELDYRPGYPSYIGTDTENETAEVDLVDGTIQRIIESFYAGTGVIEPAKLTYTGGPLATVKYAQISIIDYGVDLTNVIVGTANVTCTNDPTLPIVNVPPNIPGPTDWPPNGWHNVAPIPQGPA